MNTIKTSKTNKKSKVLLISWSVVRKPLYSVSPKLKYDVCLNGDDHFQFTSLKEAQKFIAPLQKYRFGEKRYPFKIEIKTASITTMEVPDQGQDVYTPGKGFKIYKVNFMSKTIKNQYEYIVDNPYKGIPSWKVVPVGFLAEEVFCWKLETI
jgi:hypothetical protein